MASIQLTSTAARSVHQIRFNDRANDLDLECSEQPDLVPVRSTAYFVSLCMGLGGLQGVFAVQFGNGSLFLESLGLSKKFVSIVWLAGPICGALLQPYFGAMSDKCLSDWGRRRPFIASGAIFTVLSLLGLAYSVELASLSRGTSASGPDPSHSFSLFIAILSICSLNVSIQPLQGGLRALIVDSCPGTQQSSANAWTGRIVSVANLCSYFGSFLDLPSLLPFLRQTHFQILCIITCVGLTITVSVTCFVINETPLNARLWTGETRTVGMGAKALRICPAFSRLPTRIQRTLEIQFFSWMGWFQFLYYITTFISSNYANSRRRDNFVGADAAGSPRSRAQDVDARQATMGMVIFSTTALVAGISLPMLAARPVSTCRNKISRGAIRSASRWSARLEGFDVGRIWMLSLVLFAFCMFATLFVTSYSGSLVIMAIVGFSLGVTAWAPFAIISTDILEERKDDMALLPGTVIGLHNVAVSVPQILAATGGSIVFWAFQRVPQGGDGTSWVLALAGVSALYGAYLATCLADS